MRVKRRSTFSRFREGGASIAFLLISFSLISVISTYLAYSMQEVRMNYRTIEFQRARILAESALDAGTARFYSAVMEKERGFVGASMKDHLEDSIEEMKPEFTNDLSGFEVAFLELKVMGSGAFSNQTFAGKSVETLDVRILAGVTNRVDDSIRAAFSKIVRIEREPFLRYAIFYDGLLELHPGPAMTVNGDMRSNTGIELWCGNELNLLGSVKTPGTFDLYKSDEDEDWTTESRREEVASQIKVDVNGDGIAETGFLYDDEVFDSQNPDWGALSRPVLNHQVLTGSSVEQFKIPFEEDVDSHVIIEPYDPDDTDELKTEKLAHTAWQNGTYIKVDKHGNLITVRHNNTDYPPEDFVFAQAVKDPDDAGHYVVSNDGFINVHENFEDPRESGPSVNNAFQKMRMVDVYTDKLLETFPDTDLVYVEVADPQQGSLKPAVRLRNGSNMSAAGENGISFATHRTTYIEGDFNSDTETTPPVLVAVDNLTLLSNGWSDENSDKLKPGGALDTTLNAAVITGYSEPGEGVTFTGGAHNLVRYREKWSGKDYNFKGSLISLWHAQDSHCIYAGNFYTPPRRNITYDTEFLQTQPPAMPTGYSNPQTILWEEIGWERAQELRSES